jgi:predicted nucleotidyltransferase
MENESDFDIASARAQWYKRESLRRIEAEEQRNIALGKAMEAVQAVLPHYPSIQRAYLFGSIIRPGAFYHYSDIDIAVDHASPDDYWATWRDLERQLPGWTVDFRVMADDPVFASMVENAGSLVYERETAATESQS